MFKKTISLLTAVALLLSALISGVHAASIIGDADGDGEVTVVDVTVIRRHIASIPVNASFNESAADSDGDGKVTLLDATFIQRSLSKLKDKEPASISVCLASEPDTLDPALNSAVDGMSLLAHLFSGLAKWEQKDDGTLGIGPDAA